MRFRLPNRAFIRAYPRQFWLLFAGNFMTRISMSMVWPFVTVIIRERLEITLTAAALLLSFQSLTGLLSTPVFSSIMDRFGRKIPMLVGLVGFAFTAFAMATADTFQMWALLMAISGLFLPVFSIGVNTMTADIVSPERRSAAYALIRMIGNAGIAIGPVIGGALIGLMSFDAVYYAIALAHILLTVFVFLFIRESIPRSAPKSHRQAEVPYAGYGYILRDRLFMGMFAMYMLVMLGNTQIFVLLPVYAKEVFSMVESEYGLLLSINAAMVVLFQYAVTRYTDRFRPLRVMAWAALLYAIGLATVMFGHNLPTFSLSMIIVTIGELMLMPTALTFIANIAPTELRARYLGLFGLSWPLAAGIGPVIGGYLNDNYSPVAMWLSASLIALVGAVGFVLLLHIRDRKRIRHVPAISPS